MYRKLRIVKVRVPTSKIILKEVKFKLSKLLELTETRFKTFPRETEIIRLRFSN